MVCNKANMKSQKRNKEKKKKKKKKKIEEEKQQQQQKNPIKTWRKIQTYRMSYNAKMSYNAINKIKRMAREIQYRQIGMYIPCSLAMVFYIF